MGSPHTPLENRRQERELFFWTAHKILKLVILTVLTVYAVVSLVQGQMPGGELLQYLR